MGIIELFMTAVGLSMDAFAVAICKGLNMKKLNLKQGFIIALTFGFFQGFMPFIGWVLGVRFEQYITSVDHWIAFFLLCIIGIKMLRDVFKVDQNATGSCGCGDDESEHMETALDIKELITMAFATSVDALAVGITFAFLKTDILTSITLIGVITLIISFLGVIIGNRFGNKFEKQAGIAGGVILILIGLKILLEHLNILF